MNFKPHALGATVAGIVAAGLTWQFVGAAPACWAGICAWIGALFPDFDIGSIPARWFGRLGFAVSCCLLSAGIISDNQIFLIGAAIPGLLALLSMAFKHRGPFHKYWLPALLTGVAVGGYFLNIRNHELIGALLLAFSGGMCVHLILDGIFIWSIKGWFF